MKYFLLPLLLLWLIPVVVTQMTVGFVSTTLTSPHNEQPRIRFFLQDNDASFPFEIAADGTISGLMDVDEDRWTKQK
jgi:hypothetical protein